MTVINYTFRPNVFQSPVALSLTDSGIRVRRGSARDRTHAWRDIRIVHLQRATAADPGRDGWNLKLTMAAGETLHINSVHIRGVTDFEHKTDDFIDVLQGIHTALLPHKDNVQFLVGMSTGILWAWRAALLLCLIVGIFGVAVGIAITGWVTALVPAFFALIGILGLLALMGRGGPAEYDPAQFIAKEDDGDAI